MNKKGLSNVVATILIVLLTLVATAIIWSFIKVTITENIEDVTGNEGAIGKAELFTIRFSIIPKTVKVTEDLNITFRLERKAGGGDVKVFPMIAIQDSSGNFAPIEKYSNTTIKELESITVDIKNNEFSLPTNPTKILVYPATLNRKGEIIIASFPSSTYDLTSPTPINETCIPQPEICDNLDNDCDREIDEDFPDLGTDCTVGIAECQNKGQYMCSSDNSKTECNVQPKEPIGEICTDGLDNDCDNKVDETDCSPDSDFDGLSDNDETFIYYTDPNFNDTDYDGLLDGEEITMHKTNPLNPDSDHDGLNDGYEINTLTNPLTKTNWDFTFNYQGTTHIRTQNGLGITDNKMGQLSTLPWMELTTLTYSYSSRDIDLLETARRGIVNWAEAGATHVGFAGNDEDSLTPGYQNAIVDELKQIADENNIEIVFGFKLNSLVKNWTEFFVPPSSGNKFDLFGQLIKNVTQHTGTTEFIIEAETPFLWIRNAYQSGELNLTQNDLDAFKGNIALLKKSGVTIHWWAPFFYVNENGDIPPEPERPMSSTEAIRYSYTKMFLAIHEVLGDEFGQMGGGGSSTTIHSLHDIVTVPYDNNRIQVFKQLESLGAYQYQQMTYNHRPYFYDYKWTWRKMRGPAYLITDISYLFGRDIDNTLFPNLPFNRVLLYPGGSNFDLSARVTTAFIQEGIHFNMIPRDDITNPGIDEGEKVTIIMSVYQEIPITLTFDVEYYDCEPTTQGCSQIDLTSSPDAPSFTTTEKQAVFAWKPDSTRGGTNKNHYWINFKVTNSTQTVGYPILITVDNTI